MQQNKIKKKSYFTNIDVKISFVDTIFLNKFKYEEVKSSF